MENKEQIEKIVILEQNPKLIKNIKVFRSILTPLELFTLKSFLYKDRLLSVREVYTWAIKIIFRQTFDVELAITFPKNPEYFEYFKNSLMEEGYGRMLVEKEDRERVSSIFNKEILYNNSPTEKFNYCLNQLKGYKVRVPSYDKFLGIFERFEKAGIIFRREIQERKIKGKKILYGLNFNFSNLFEDKIEDIIKL